MFKKLTHISVASRRSIKDHPHNRNNFSIMERPVLRYLPILRNLPNHDEPRRIVLEFLRKPHPLAALIQTLTFEREAITFDDDSEDTYFIISGKSVRTLRENVFMFSMNVRRTEIDHPWKLIMPIIQPIVADEPQEFWLLYRDDGECDYTSGIWFYRRSRFSNMMRNDRGLDSTCCPRCGPRD